jgi:hypothetical protein
MGYLDACGIIRAAHMNRTAILVHLGGDVVSAADPLRVQGKLDERGGGGERKGTGREGAVLVLEALGGFREGEEEEE